jgi:hypothetical protein
MEEFWGFFQTFASLGNQRATGLFGVVHYRKKVARPKNPVAKFPELASNDPQVER